MKEYHATQHGTRRQGDSLDLLNEERILLAGLLQEWANTDPARTTQEESVPVRWDHGTLGKLIIEHSAVRAAASADIARVLHARGGQTHIADRLHEETANLRQSLKVMDETSRGLAPIALAIEPAFSSEVETLRNIVTDTRNGGPSTDEIEHALGPDRQRLRSAKYIRKHAPTHPGGRADSWFNRAGPLLRVHAVWNRLRGMPWAEGSPSGNPQIARRYNRDLESEDIVQ
jgi:hypothetical protein